MAANLRSWWQQLRKYLVVIIIISIIVVIALIIAGYIFNWDWTGFNGGFSQITTTQTINKAITATEKPPGKTLWDWLQLLGVVAIPVVVVFGAAWFTRVQQQRDKRLEKAQRDRDRQLADQRAESERKAAVE